MAHELIVSADGYASAFRIKGDAECWWEAQGIKPVLFDTSPGLEALYEGMRAKGFLFDADVEDRDLFVPVSKALTDGIIDVSMAKVPGSKAIVHSETQEVLGVTSRSYQAVQNKALFGLHRQILALGHGRLSTGGLLFGGRRVWLQTLLTGLTADILPGDSIQAYFSSMNSHDGSLAARVGPTAKRTVCDNTLQESIRDISSKFLAFRHTKGAEQAMQQAADLFNPEANGFELRAAAENFQSKVVEPCRFLASKLCKPEDFERFVKFVLVPKATTGEKVELAAPEKVEGLERVELPPAKEEGERILQEVRSLFEGEAKGSEVPGILGSWWQATNAVTQWAQQESSRSPGAQMNSNMFGQGKVRTQRALKMALEMAA